MALLEPELVDVILGMDRDELSELQAVIHQRFQVINHEASISMAMTLTPGCRVMFSMDTTPKKFAGVTGTFLRMKGTKFEVECPGFGKITTPGSLLRRI